MNGMNAWWPLLFLLFGWGGFGYGGFGGFGGFGGRGFGFGGGCCNNGGFGALADLAVTDATNIAEMRLSRPRSSNEKSPLLFLPLRGSFFNAFRLNAPKHTEKVSRTPNRYIQNLRLNTFIGGRNR